MKKVEFTEFINFLKSLPETTLKDPQEVSSILRDKLRIEHRDRNIILAQFQDYLQNLKFDQERTHDAEKLSWDNYDDAVAYFMEHHYRDILKNIPKKYKNLYYQFARDYRRKELADARKNMILSQNNYDIQFTENGVHIIYPKVNKPKQEDK